MASKKWAALVFATVFLMSGCGFFRYIDGSSQDEIEQYENPLLWGKVAKLERSEADHKRTVQEIESEIKSLRALVQAQAEKDKQLETMKSQIRLLGTELDMDLQEPARKGQGDVHAGSLRKTGAVGSLKNDVAEMKMRLAKLEEEYKKASAAASAQDTVKIQTIRIKVLSGTGDLSAARKMTETLSRLGYKVNRVDLAPRSDFKTKMIYYAPGFQKTAMHLKDKLGQDVTVKALTWKSSFSLIVLAI